MHPSPGHSAAWGLGYPSITTNCPITAAQDINDVSLTPAEYVITSCLDVCSYAYLCSPRLWYNFVLLACYYRCNGVITSPLTFELLQGIYTEFSSLFPDNHLHLGGEMACVVCIFLLWLLLCTWGILFVFWCLYDTYNFVCVSVCAGDEVVLGCWAEDPKVVSWMTAHNLTLHGILCVCVCVCMRVCICVYVVWKWVCVCMSVCELFESVLIVRLCFNHNEGVYNYMVNQMHSLGLKAGKSQILYCFHLFSYTCTTCTSLHTSSTHMQQPCTHCLQHTHSFSH